ncbi:MAG: carboxylating nicotinate-nucleotide diphosphorylase [Desulfobacterales bacterium]|nr:carboxylating nicotinate-nucleotide diphosphorylase [Desulfobacterales bacterium]
MFAVEKLIELALEEDIGPGDITTAHLIKPDQQGQAHIIAKEPLVLAGLDIARRVFKSLNPNIQFIPLASDGDEIAAAATIVEVTGGMQTLLTGERTALNFLQRLSGIATMVREYVQVVAMHNIQLVDTRKTTPGWRVLEKYAVRIGGAANHRMGLYDGVLIKDNHIAACGGIAVAVRTARKAVSHLVKIEVETSDLDQVQQALDAGADVIMLDNMNFEQIKAAMAKIAGRALVEVSGGIRKDQLVALAQTGVDMLSIGALTHSACSVDMSMQITAD